MRLVSSGRGRREPEGCQITLTVSLDYVIPTSLALSRDHVNATHRSPASRATGNHTKSWQDTLNKHSTLCLSLCPPPPTHSLPPLCLCLSLLPLTHTLVPISLGLSVCLHMLGNSEFVYVYEFSWVYLCVNVFLRVCVCVYFKLFPLSSFLSLSFYFSPADSLTVRCVCLCVYMCVCLCLCK